ISQVLNVNLYHWLMKKTKGKHLWLRNNVSTILSQLVGNVIIISIIYLSGDLGNEITSVTAAMFLAANILTFKCLFALCDTPVLYAAVLFLKAKMTKFQPFRHNNNRRRTNNNNNSRRSHNNSRSDSLPFTD
ncbi:MAG: queuosine precursor transporter, partial [Rickettsiales bacterium]|nr:queuosine precursor transporter [Rickettsiales bacterium]